MRTFIAIDLDQSIKDALSAFILKLDTGSGNIRWVRPQGMHLTLKFLGEISREKIPEVQAALELIAKEYSPFQLDLKGTGTFPPASHIPRVIWSGIEGNETLYNIQTHLENGLKKIGFPKEKRKFSPHLTLGRVKNPHHLQSTLETLDSHKQSLFGTMTVDKLTFFESTLKPGGAEYTVLSEHNLV